MDQKLEITVNRTVEALARIGRFLDKYGAELNREQLDRIVQKLHELQIKIKK